MFWVLKKFCRGYKNILEAKTLSQTLKQCSGGQNGDIGEKTPSVAIKKCYARRLHTRGRALFLLFFCKGEDLGTVRGDGQGMFGVG